MTSPVWSHLPLLQNGAHMLSVRITPKKEDTVLELASGLAQVGGPALPQGA